MLQRDTLNCIFPYGKITELNTSPTAFYSPFFIQLKACLVQRLTSLLWLTKADPSSWYLKADQSIQYLQYLVSCPTYHIYKQYLVSHSTYQYIQFSVSCPIYQYILGVMSYIPNIYTVLCVMSYIPVYTVLGVMSYIPVYTVFGVLSYITSIYSTRRVINQYKSPCHSLQPLITRLAAYISYGCPATSTITLQYLMWSPSCVN